MSRKRSERLMNLATLMVWVMDDETGKGVTPMPEGPTYMAIQGMPGGCTLDEWQALMVWMAENGLITRGGWTMTLTDKGRSLAAVVRTVMKRRAGEAVKPGR